MADASSNMSPANSEVGGTACGLGRKPVESWSVLEIYGLEARDLTRASPGMCLRGTGARFHTGYSRCLK